MPPTAQHEALHRIFQRDEALFARAVARVFNVMVPAPVNVTVLGTDLTETEPMERRPDSVLQAEFLVEESAGKYILVIESQTDKDDKRLRRWPHYVAHLHDKYACPVILAVVCSKQDTAEWAREPIKIGLPDLTCLTANLVVFGPHNVPAITSADEAAADLTLAVFSALTHSHSKRVGGILEALATALTTIDKESAANLAEFTETGLGNTVGRKIWRTLMATRTFPLVSEMRLQGRAEGRVEGRAEGRAEGLERGRVQARTETLAEIILEVFDERGIEVDEVSRARIESCHDDAVLKTWHRRSLRAASPGDLFA
jgi:hypothetical protein